MAKAKRGAKGPKTFPKLQGEEGEGDRFIPPDRIDQRDDPSDRAQTIQFKDVGADIEVIERTDDGRESAGDEDEDDEDAQADQRQARRRSADDDDEDPVQNGRRLSQESRSVRARVNRERVLREQAEAKVANAERRAKSVEDRLAKLERVTTEVQENTSVKALEAKIVTLETEVKKALADDDHKLAFEKQAELGDAKADLKLLKRDLEATRKQQIADEAARKELDEQGGRTATASGESPGTVDWKQANRAWWNRQRYKDEREDAIGIDADILEEIKAGDHEFEKYSDEHFALLNKRLAKLYPDLPLYHTDGNPFEEDQQQEPDVNDRNRDRGGRDRDGQRAPQNTRRQSPGVRGTRTNGRREQSDADLARQGKVTLNKEDFSQMRLYGLDPKNERDKKAFAKERMRTILTEDRRSARS